MSHVSPRAAEWMCVFVWPFGALALSLPAGIVVMAVPDSCVHSRGRTRTSAVAASVSADKPVDCPRLDCRWSRLARQNEELFSCHLQPPRRRKCVRYPWAAGLTSNHFFYCSTVWWCRVLATSGNARTSSRSPVIKQAVRNCKLRSTK